MGIRRREERIARSQRNRTFALSALASVVAFGGWLMWAATGVNPTLGVDLCPPEDRVTGVTLLLVDATDPWSEIRRAAVAREVAEISSTIPRFTRVSLHVVSAEAIVQGSPPAPAATLCNPGTPSQVEADAKARRLPAWLISNPARARARFDSAFAGVIDSLVAEAGRTQPQGRSPIIETLRFAVLGAGGMDPVSVIMISDMYQNSDLCTFYGSRSCSEAIAEVAGPALGGIYGLSGSQVELLLLSPAGGEFVSRDTLLEFWYGYFRQQGAFVTGVKRIEQ